MKVESNERRITISGDWPGDEMEASRVGSGYISFELNGQFSLDIDLAAAAQLRDWLVAALREQP